MKFKFERIKKLIIQEVMIILTSHSLKDPRIPDLITITRLTLSKDLHYCHLYFSALGDDINFDLAEKGLNSAAGYFQKILAEKLTLKYTPKLEFRYDKSETKAFQVDSILYKLAEERRLKEQNKKTDTTDNE